MKRVRIYFNNDPEKWIEVPKDEKGKLVPTGAEERVIDEARAELRMLAGEEVALKEIARNVKLQEEQALLGNKKPPELTNLFEAFSDPEKWQRIMNYLVNKNILAKDTYVLMDHKKGNLQLAIDLLNTLQEKGYFRRRITANEKKFVLSNSFNLNVSIDHIKRPPKPTGSILQQLQIDIPLASTL